MYTGRVRVLTATLLGLGLSIPLSIVPAAGATCALSAPATVSVGTPLKILGSGFPASSSIDISIGLEGSTPVLLSVQSDGAGGFTISLTPEASEAGKTTVVANAGATCSALAVYTVTGATATPTPEASNPPAASAVGNTGNPPRTDAAPASASPATSLPSIGWALGLVILLMGLGGGALTSRRTTVR